MSVGGYQLPSDDDIAWSNTDDPDADIAFDKPFMKPQKKMYIAHNFLYGRFIKKVPSLLKTELNLDTGKCA